MAEGMTVRDSPGGMALRDSSHDVCEAEERPGAVPMAAARVGRNRGIWALQTKQEEPQFKLRLGNRGGSCSKCALHNSLGGIHSFFSHTALLQRLC